MNPQPNGMPGQNPNQIQGQNGMPQNMGNPMGIRPNQNQMPGQNPGGPGGPQGGPMNQPQNRPPMNPNFPQNNMGGMQNNRFPPNNAQQMNVIILFELMFLIFMFSIFQNRVLHLNHHQ